MQDRTRTFYSSMVFYPLFLPPSICSPVLSQTQLHLRLASHLLTPQTKFCTQPGGNLVMLRADTPEISGSQSLTSRRRAKRVC